MSAARRILIAGAGSIGRRHAKNLQALGQADLRLVDPSAEALRRAEQELGVSGWRALDEAWAWKPEAVVVATPTGLHLETALAAACRGCHLFIEKPLADRLDGVDELQRLVQEKSLVTMVGCNMRFREGPKRVHEAIEAGRIGAPLSARFEAGSYLPDWRPGTDYRASYSAREDGGGGCFLDHIHEFDLACWMFGFPREVFAVARVGKSLGIETEGLAEIVLDYAGGLIVSVHLDYVQRWRQRRYEVIGEAGTLVWDGREERVQQLLAGRPEPETVWHQRPYDTNRMYVDEMKHWLRCLEGVEASCADVAWGARVLRVALAAKQSVATRKFIAVDFEPALRRGRKPIPTAVGPEGAVQAGLGCRPRRRSRT